MSSEKFLTNMNNDLLTESQKIRLLFQKFHSPSQTQVNNAFQVSYNLDQ